MSFTKSKFGDFNFELFCGPKTESGVPKNPGIYYLWYWNQELRKYDFPPKGVKGYRAIRRLKIAGKSIRQSMAFHKLQEARIWRLNQESSEIQISTKSFESEVLKVEGPRFEEIVEMWKKAKWKTYQQSTQLVYQRTLRYLDFFIGMEIRSISSLVIDQWLEKMTDPKVVKDQNSTRLNFLHELELLSGILRYYSEYRDDDQFVYPVKQRHREAAIVRNVRGKMRKPMTPGQFVLWTKEMKQHKNALLVETLARTQRACALRISEAAALSWEDVDWDRRLITVHRSVVWTRNRHIKTYIKEGFKNGDEKVLPIAPDAYELLEKLFKMRTCSLVFHLNEKPLEYRFIQHAYDSAAEKAKIDFTGTHVMRRTGASWMLNATGDIDLAKQLLGNSTWSSVKPYAQRESSALTAFNDKLWKAKSGEDPEPQPTKKLRVVG